MKIFKKPITAIILASLIVLSLLSGCSKKEVVDANKQLKFFTELKRSINTDNIMNTIKELSSPKYDGRLSGTEGNRLAGEYISEHFKKIGLQSPEGIEDFKQYYTQTTLLLNSEPILQVRDRNGKIIKRYEFLKDFNILPYPGTNINTEVNGGAYHFEEVNTIWLDSRDSNDKVLLLSESKDNASLTANYISNILSSGENIKALIFEKDLNAPENETNHFTKLVMSPVNTSNNTAAVVIIQFSSVAFKELTDISNEYNTIYIKVDYTPKEAKVANIVGVISGSSKELKDEYIIISAHYDHLGNNENGTYNPGAFDNSSGVAAMMEIARSIKENNVKPQKSIMFLAFNGEEEGCIGSQYFASSPQCPSEKSTLINMDMIGHIKDNPLMLYYSEESKLLEDLKNYTDIEGIKFIVEQGNRSDHAPFINSNVDAITLIEFETEEYHSSKDTIDKLNKDEIRGVTNLILNYICNRCIFN